MSETAKWFTYFRLHVCDRSDSSLLGEAVCGQRNSLLDVLRSTPHYCFQASQPIHYIVEYRQGIAHRLVPLRPLVELAASYVDVVSLMLVGSIPDPCIDSYLSWAFREAAYPYFPQPG